MKFFIFVLLAFPIAYALPVDNSTSLFKECPSFQAEGAAVEAAKATNVLAFKLYEKIIQAKPSENVVFSPISIALALALLESGAEGSTLRELQTLLAPPGSNELDSSKLYQTLQAQLHGSNVNEYKINVANGLFYKDGLRLKADYTDKLKKCFKTEITKAPFRADAEAARKQINDWVSDATEEKIPELLKAGSISSNTAAVIANAIYFKGAWKDKFLSTEDRDFYKFGKNDSAQKVKFLTRQKQYNYASTDDAQIVEIPYQNYLFGMHVILPKKRDGIAQVENSFNAAVLSSLKFENRQVDLKLPKFTTRLSVDLKTLLKQLGQNEIFLDSANFSRLADDRLKVSDAVHEAYIKVNENGTEAAAATAIVMIPAMAIIPQEPQTPIPFVADHPFLFALTHKPSKAIVFMGKINVADDKQ